MAFIPMNGGGKAEPKEIHPTGIPINDSYQYLATGYFYTATTLRTVGVSTAPTIAFYVKEGDSYTQITPSTTVAYNTTARYSVNKIKYGDIYVHRTGGSGYTENSITLWYFE